MLVAVLTASSMANEVRAQSNPFAPAIRVGDRIITNYDLDQRILFLRLLNAGPQAPEIARQQLVTEALQFLAASREDVEISDAEVIAAQEEFAARGNLTREQLVTGLGQQGVEEGTFRAFVSAGLAWRDAVRSRFTPVVTVSEDDIERAIARTAIPAGARVELAEVILPAADAASEAASLARAREIRRTTDIEAFSTAARLYSIAPSRFDGGSVGWRPLDILPEATAAELLQLSPGQVTQPTRLGETIAIFQLLDREVVEAGTVTVVSADFAEILIPGGRTQETLSMARGIESRAQSCDDLYGVVDAFAPAKLTRRTSALSALQADIAQEIAMLDRYEVSTTLTRGNDLLFLMLCDRTVRKSADVDRILVRNQLRSQRLEAYASGYLSELRLSNDVEFLR